MSILGIEGATNFTDTMVGDPDNNYGTGIGKIILKSVTVPNGSDNAQCILGPSPCLAAGDLLFANIQEAGANARHVRSVTRISDTTATVRLDGDPGSGDAEVDILCIGPSTKTTDTFDLSAYSNIKVGVKDGDASMIKQISFAKGDIVNTATTDVVALAGITTAAYAFAQSNEVASVPASHVQELVVAAGQVTVTASEDPGSNGMDISVLAIELETDRATGLTGILADTTCGTALTEIMIGTGTVAGATVAVSMPGLTTSHKCFVGHASADDTVQKVVPTADTATVTFAASAAGAVWVLALKELT